MISIKFDRPKEKNWSSHKKDDLRQQLKEWKVRAAIAKRVESASGDSQKSAKVRAAIAKRVRKSKVDGKRRKKWSSSQKDALVRQKKRKGAARGGS